eukprot:scaffold20426_cov47-Attheya_sp.AAC.10
MVCGGMGSRWDWRSACKILKGADCTVGRESEATIERSNQSQIVLAKKKSGGEMCQSRVIVSPGYRNVSPRLRRCECYLVERLLYI